MVERPNDSFRRTLVVADPACPYEEHIRSVPQPTSSDASQRAPVFLRIDRSDAHLEVLGDSLEVFQCAW